MKYATCRVGNHIPGLLWRVRLVMLLTTALTVLASAARPGATPARVDTLVRDYLKRHAIPSAAIAVVREGRIVKAAGYGTANLELGVPATERTLYEIGSITKQFTAEAVMMLAEEKLLSLDDPIGRYLPDPPPAWEPITIRQLLSHTSGLRDWEAASLLSYHREYTPQEYVDLIGKEKLDFAPGAQWAYTNSAHPLLGMIIERVSGMPYEQFVADRVFRPAGMTDTRFKHPEEIVPRRSGGYVDRDGALQNGEPLRPRIIAPNGGIMSTAVDMAKWQIALGKGSLLKPAAWQEMLAPIRLNSGRQFPSVGLAWFLQSFRGHRLVLHNGSTIAGYSSVIYRYLDDDLAVVVLMNIDRWNVVNVLATRIANCYVPGLDASALPEKTDPDPALSRRYNDMLAAIAEGRDSEMLAPALRNPGRSSRLPASFGFAGDVRRFAFLERQDLGEPGEDRFGTIVRFVYRYKLVSKAGAIYYTFEVTPEGKVSGIIPEKE